VALSVGQYMESEVIHSGAIDLLLLQNEYGTGDAVVLKYRHGIDEDACLAAAWVIYSTSFTSLGYVQARIESTH
jgi:hypothetical protein